MNEPKILTTLRGYALVFGAGGVAALQAMKWELFSFPEPLKIYLGYFFSIVTIFSVFLGGFSLLKTIQEGRDVLGKLKDIKAEEEEKQVNNNRNETNR